MHISIIEDDKLFAFRLKKRLEKDWFFITVFLSFKVFMNFPNLNSDLYLIDLSLWDWDWFDIIKYLRNEKKLNTPIIITSAYNDDEKKALSKYGSSDSGASLGDILGSVLKTKKND